MTGLERLARRTRESWGLQHQANLISLRAYIQITPEERLIEEAKIIRNSDTLRTLWEAGLSAELQKVVLEQLKKIS